MKIEFNKKTLSAISVYGIALFLYVFAFLIIPFEKESVSWLSFTFTIIAFIVSFLMYFVAFNKNDTLISKIYGFPVVRISLYYLAAQFVLGIFFCLLQEPLEDAMWFVLLVYIVLLAAAVIGLIAVDNVRDTIENMEAETAKATRAVTVFKLDVAGIIDNCSDPVVIKELRVLEEEVRFSDPVSSEYTLETEKKLVEELRVLRQELYGNNVLPQIKKVRNLLAERNRICKAFKR